MHLLFWILQLLSFGDRSTNSTQWFISVLTAFLRYCSQDCRKFPCTMYRFVFSIPTPSETLLSYNCSPTNWTRLWHVHVFSFHDMVSPFSHLIFSFFFSFRGKGNQSKYWQATALQGFFLPSHFKRLHCRGKLFSLFLVTFRLFFCIVDLFMSYHFLVERGLVVVPLLVNYPCLCCRIQGWWSWLLYLWYSFKVVLSCPSLPCL